jgi:creatinine amidohydrolase
MDALHAEAIALGVAAQVGGVVFPALFSGTETLRNGVGFRSGDSLRSLGFAGTERIVGMDFPAHSLKSFYYDEGMFGVYIRETIHLLKSHGYRLIVIVNGHGASNHIHALRRVAAETSEPGRVHVLYQFAFEEGASAEHAARVETSIMLVIHPETVDIGALPPKGEALPYAQYGIVDGPAFEGRPTADFTLPSEADPRDASPELGERVLRATVDRISAAVRDALRLLPTIES